MAKNIVFILGRLDITHVLEEDHQDGRTYVCMAINYFMRLNTYAAGTVIVPTGSSGKSSYIQIHFNTSHLSIFILLLTI